MSDFPGLPEFTPDPTNSIASERRQYIYNTIADLIAYGFNATQALQLYKDIGATVPSAEFSGIYSIMSGVNSDIFNIADVPSNMPIPDYLIDMTPRELDTRYRYVVSFETYDSTTGVIDRAGFYLDTDDTLTPNMIKQKAIEAWWSASPKPESIYTFDAQIVIAQRNG